jgi:DNA-directed RNA polymerase subunit M/transcription elongation factor TFIIS
MIKLYCKKCNTLLETQEIFTGSYIVNICEECKKEIATESFKMGYNKAIIDFQIDDGK